MEGEHGVHSHSYYLLQMRGAGFLPSFVRKGRQGRDPFVHKGWGVYEQEGTQTDLCINKGVPANEVGTQTK